jgi:hypothetical protein
MAQDKNYEEYPVNNWVARPGAGAFDAFRTRLALGRGD